MLPINAATYDPILWAQGPVGNSYTMRETERGTGRLFLAGVYGMFSIKCDYHRTAQIPRIINSM